MEWWRLIWYWWWTNKGYGFKEGEWISKRSLSIFWGTIIMTKDKVFIYTTEDMDMMKEKAIELLKYLPSDLKSALIIVGFLKEHIEKTTGIKINKIEVEWYVDVEER